MTTTSTAVAAKPVRKTSAEKAAERRETALTAFHSSVIGALLARNPDGSPDVEATELFLMSELEKYVSTHETDDATVASAVEAVFDHKPGVFLAMPDVAAMAVAHLGATLENRKSLEIAVLNYLRRNDQGLVEGEGDDKTEQRPDSLFFKKLGKGGGIIRRAEKPADK